MAVQNHSQSVQRLLLKIAGYIGPASFHWLSRVFSNWPLNPVELEILERTFSMGLYPDELLELSCQRALKARIFTISEFPFFVEEIQKQLEYC